MPSISEKYLLVGAVHLVAAVVVTPQQRAGDPLGYAAPKGRGTTTPTAKATARQPPPAAATIPRHGTRQGHERKGKGCTSQGGTVRDIAARLDPMSKRSTLEGFTGRNFNECWAKESLAEAYRQG